MLHYQYIFTGTGLATLMTVREMILSGAFKNHKILLLDQDSKKNNDRTWCFWEVEDSFTALTHKKWPQARFKNEFFENDLDLCPYHYNMVRGLDFYQEVFSLIAKQPNISFVQEKVIGFQDSGTHCMVKTENQTYTCERLMNSIFQPDLFKQPHKFPLLHQHFIGWFIKSESPVFTPDCATFMDFSVEQKGNTRFMYVLPFSDKEALIEYTLFSKNLLAKSEYETEIMQYMERLGITKFELVEKEQGNIPMTCYPFWEHNSKNLIHIGSAGGWTKASTGFTFSNTTKKSKALVSFLEKNIDFRKFHRKNKFWFYDLLLLDILDRDNAKGSKIFSSLFQKGNAALIFKFLDEETSFWEDLQVIWKCPKLLFIEALFRRIFHF